MLILIEHPSYRAFIFIFTHAQFNTLSSRFAYLYTELTSNSLILVPGIDKVVEVQLMKPDDASKLTEGTEVQLKCSVDGNEEVQVEWFKNKLRWDSVHCVRPGLVWANGFPSDDFISTFTAIRITSPKISQKIMLSNIEFVSKCLFNISNLNFPTDWQTRRGLKSRKEELWGSLTSILVTTASTPAGAETLQASWLAQKTSSWIFKVFDLLVSGFMNLYLSILSWFMRAIDVFVGYRFMPLDAKIILKWFANDLQNASVFQLEALFLNSSFNNLSLTRGLPRLSYLMIVQSHCKRTLNHYWWTISLTDHFR